MIVKRVNSYSVIYNLLLGRNVVLVTPMQLIHNYFLIYYAFYFCIYEKRVFTNRTQVPK